MANLNLVQAINLALIQEMEKNPDIVLLGDDPPQPVDERVWGA